MNRAYTPARTAVFALRPAQIDPVEIARGIIVLGCALALIMAGPLLPL
jgi:hypothetical protein